MTEAISPPLTQYVIGIDLGGTKCAAGLVLLPEGKVLARRLQPTEPDRDGVAVLADVVDLARSLQRQAAEMNVIPTAIGLGVAELVGVDGQVLSEATIHWQGVAIESQLRAATELPVSIEADVRAAARCEAHVGAGRPFRSFLYVTVGTGISASLVVNRVPYAGARGLTGTFASSRALIPGNDGSLVSGPPLERFAAGPALAARLAMVCPSFAGNSRDVLSLAEAEDALALAIVTSAGEALGAAIGQLINVLDPEAVILGGGLGLAKGHYRFSLESAMRTYIWSDLHRDIPLLSAEMGSDAGFIGAALAASCE
jgi:predicted NBD/HSP70 family sugar kinase